MGGEAVVCLGTAGQGTEDISSDHFRETHCILLGGWQEGGDG